MKKFLVLIGICVSCCFNTSGQDVDSITSYSTVYQRVAFVASDTIYHSTIFIEPNGKFYFRNGYFDSALENDSSIMVRINNKRKVTGQYILTYHFQPDIDTVKCILSNEGFENAELELIQIAEKLNASYVMRQLGEFNIIQKNEIRLLYPCEELNHPTRYRLVKINLVKDSAEITLITGNSVDYKGIHPSKSYTSLLKNRDVKSLKNQLDKLKGIQNLDCLQPGNPWVMELYDGGEYKRFIISDYCLRGRKDIKPITLIYRSILSIGNNYFNIGCTVD